jgi:hypothetical protein
MRSRRLAWALVAYGTAGVILLIIVAATGFDAAVRVERLAGSADAALESAATTAVAAAEAVAGTNESLDRGAASASDSAALSRDASASLRSLANAMEVSILGAQPLLPLADDFVTTADEASALAEELDGIGEALTATQDDISVVGDRLRDLAGDLDVLSGADASPDGGAPPLRLIVVLLAVWLGLPALAALSVGIWLLRRQTLFGINQP